MFFIHFVRACLGTKFIFTNNSENKVPGGHKRERLNVELKI